MSSTIANSLPNTVSANSMNETLSEYYTGAPNLAEEYDFSFKVGTEENEALAKDKRAFMASRFQSEGLVDSSEGSLFCLNNVKLGTRSEENRQKCGILASRNISKGEVITLFPTDIAILYEGEARYMYYSDKFIQYADHEKDSSKEDSSKVFGEIITKYYYDVEPGRQIVGIPSNRENMAFVAHLANDGATNFHNKRLYMQSSSAAANSKMVKLPFENDFVYGLVATKDIEENAEIFYCYLPNYWFTNVDVKFLFFEDDGATEIVKRISQTNLDSIAKKMIRDFINFGGKKIFASFSHDDNVLCSIYLFETTKETPNNVKQNCHIYMSDSFLDSEVVYRSHYIGKIPDITENFFIDFLKQVAQKFPFFLHTQEESPVFVAAGLNHSKIIFSSELK